MVKNVLSVLAPEVCVLCVKRMTSQRMGGKYWKLCVDQGSMSKMYVKEQKFRLAVELAFIYNS